MKNKTKFMVSTLVGISAILASGLFYEYYLKERNFEVLVGDQTKENHDKHEDESHDEDDDKHDEHHNEHDDESKEEHDKHEGESHDNHHDDESEDEHHDEHDNESEEEHGEHGDEHSKEFGPDKGVLDFSQDKGLILAAQAENRFQVKYSRAKYHRKKKPHTYNVSGLVIIWDENETYIYRKRDGWLKMIPVRVISKSHHQYLIYAKDVISSDEILVRGVPLVRLAELNASGASGEGHGH